MIAIVHVSEVVLLKGDDRLTLWHQYSFDPMAIEASSRGNGCSVVRYASKPVAIRTPPLARLGDDRRRLFTPYHKSGLDATSVHFCGTKGLDGFALADGESVDPTPIPSTVGSAPSASLEVPPQVPSQPPATLTPPWLEEPAPDVAMSRQATKRQIDPPPDAPRWGVAFRSDGGCLSWASRRDPNGPLQTTLDLWYARAWLEPQRADAWLAKAGLSPDVPLRVGTGVWPVVMAIPADDAWPRGVAFQMPRAAGQVDQVVAPVIAELPAAPAPAKSGRDLPGQGFFSFTG